LTLFAAIVCVVPTFAQVGKEQDAVKRAEKLFAADQLADAEKLYLGALQSKASIDRRLCYERLLTIYAKLARHDRSVQIGLRYHGFLLQVNDGKRARTLKLDLGLAYYALGHYGQSSTALREALLAPANAPPLDDDTKLQALFVLANATANLSDPTKTAAVWKAVERQALELDGKPDRTSKQRVEVGRRLAESYFFQDRFDDALARLEPLLKIHDQELQPLDRRDTLRKLAEVQLAKKRFVEADALLREALDLHEKHEPRNRFMAADIETDLTQLFAQQRKKAETKQWREKAARDYRAVIDDPSLGHPKVASTVSAFWKLQRLLQAATAYKEASDLTLTHQETWGGQSLLQTKWRADHGMLELLRGSFANAKPLLRTAVEELEKQNPPNLKELPRTLNNCATVELATDELSRAEALAKKCLAIYQEFRLPNDLVIIEAYSLLGTCAAQGGDYLKAVEYFREGLARCEKLGEGTEPAQSKLLLNIALLHKSQGDMDEALFYCLKARALFAQYADPDDLGFAAFDAAQANLHIAMEKASESFVLTERILNLCAMHGIDRGPLVITAKHCQALQALSEKKYVQAQRTWHDILTLQEKEKQSALMPRTLNYLGLCAELQDRREEALAYYQRARSIQKANPRSFPVTHFITLWRIADLLDRKSDRKESRALLLEAVALIEKTRERTYGDSQQRALFFGQFAPAFDRLVEWSVREGDLESALTIAAQSRSRSLLDQLHLARVDPLQGAQGPDRDKWIAEDAAIKKRMSGLRAKAQALSTHDLDSDQAASLLSKYDDAQKDYVELYRKILSANPFYHALESSPADLFAKLRAKVVDEKTLMLMYHLGENQSFVFVIGNAGQKIEAYPLMVHPALASGVEMPEPTSTEDQFDANKRSIFVKQKVARPVTPLPAFLPGGAKAALTQYTARGLIAHYYREIAGLDFHPTRSILVKPKVGAGKVAPQRPELLADVFLPEAVRRRIRESKAERLIVIPDGALHKLPLEAMLIAVEPQPRYVLDEMPPIVYAPSASILGIIADRPANPRPKSLSVLTVGDPAYPQNKDLVVKLDARGKRSILGLQGQLPLLPKSGVESRQIAKLFKSNVLALEGGDATEEKVIAGIPGRHIIHLAAHGFSDDRFGNLFGAIALTPPKDRFAPENDGFLALHEIYRLPLKECELAVLSACMTNVGPQQPLEAGVTLANGFLAAGARRVIASHWEVEDDSTSQLMQLFFAELKGDPQRSAHALQRARQRIRATPGWSNPYHWAPFILIGPGE